MKKIYLLVFTFLVSMVSFGQGLEDFSLATDIGALYSDGNFVGNDGITWSFVHARDQDIFEIDGLGIMLRRANEPSSVSATFSGGIGNFSVNTRKAYTGNTQRKLELVVNGDVIAQFQPTYSDGEDATVVPFVVNGIDIPGDVTVTLRLFGANGNQQIILDDISWTGFSGQGTPAISISEPTTNQVMTPGTSNVDVVFTTSNLGAGDTVNITVNGDLTTGVTSPFSVTTVDGESYTVAVDVMSAGASIATDSVTFSIGETLQVADLAALRADVTANGAGGFYEIMSVPTVTFDRTFRGQKYIQDTSAGVLVDDLDGAITTAFVIGDGISGLKGQANLYNGLLQLLPIADATVATGAAVTPQVVTIATLLTDYENYESQLVQINGATFADAGETFVASTVYSVSDGSDIAFRTSFNEVDYIGGVIPSAATDLIVLVAQFNGEAQITARSMDDVLSTVSLTSSEFNIYPNPTGLGYVNISAKNNDATSVAVYDILGKQVLNQNLANNRLDVSNLNTGVYIVKITQLNSSVTKKLVIK